MADFKLISNSIYHTNSTDTLSFGPLLNEPLINNTLITGEKYKLNHAWLNSEESGVIFEEERPLSVLYTSVRGS